MQLMVIEKRYIGQCGPQWLWIKWVVRWRRLSAAVQVLSTTQILCCPLPGMSLASHPSCASHIIALLLFFFFYLFYFFFYISIYYFIYYFFFFGYSRLGFVGDAEQMKAAPSLDGDDNAGNSASRFFVVGRGEWQEQPIAGYWPGFVGTGCDAFASEPGGWGWRQRVEMDKCTRKGTAGDTPAAPSHRHFCNATTVERDCQ